MEEEMRESERNSGRKSKLSFYYTFFVKKNKKRNRIVALVFVLFAFDNKEIHALILFLRNAFCNVQNEPVK